MENHKTYIRRGRAEIHRDQAIVEGFNRTLAERLFGHPYAVEMLLPEGQRSTSWVKRLPDVVSALTNKMTSLIGKKPAVAIKEKAVSLKPSTKYSRSYRYDYLYHISLRIHPSSCQNLFVSGVVKWMVFGVDACVIQP